MFNMITRINQSKTITKHRSCKCKFGFDGRKCNSDQLWNNNKCQCRCTKRYVCEKDYVWNPATSNSENRKYLTSFMNDSAMICEKDIKSCNKEIKTFPTNFNEKKGTCKSKISMFYF